MVNKCSYSKMMVFETVDFWVPSCKWCWLLAIHSMWNYLFNYLTGSILRLLLNIAFSSSDPAHCEKINSLCKNGIFTCCNGKKISCSKTCDCNLDCSDRSDEGNSADCGPYILVNATEKRSGILKSPGFPNGYPGQLSCKFKIFTSDPNSHVSLNFNTFDLRPSSPSRDSFIPIQTDSCKDYIKLSNNKYPSKYNVHCSGMMYDYFGR